MRIRTALAFLSVACSLAMTGCLVGVHATGFQLPDTPEYRIPIGPFEAADAAQHQEWIQQAIDEASSAPRTIVFGPGDYYLSDPKGIWIGGGTTLLLTGARFLWPAEMTGDGQTFLIQDASDIAIAGGEIVGQRDSWDPGTNIAGIRVHGACADLSMADMRFCDLSSNAIGVFGQDAAHPIRNVSLDRVTGIRCCNYYGDYLDAAAGPARGSDRRDQGTVALYHVENWRVARCRFEQSQSDGTHFYHAHHGQFVDNVVADSQMGGYFLEGCAYVIASDNRITRNGSRGVTIERDSRYCTLTDNIVSFSGREGLWAPAVAGILVANNLFRHNGRKDDGERDCEIRVDESDRYETETQDIVIQGNLFYTTAEQTAVLFVGNGVAGVVMRGNTVRGAAPPVWPRAAMATAGRFALE